MPRLTRPTIGVPFLACALMCMITSVKAQESESERAKQPAPAMPDSGAVLGSDSNSIETVTLERAIVYQVSFAAAQNHYLNIDLTISPRSAEPLELFLPAWTPGSYLIREHARHVDAVQAWDDQGDLIDVRKISKNAWRLACSTTKPVRVQYRVYCNELSVRTNYVDSEFGILNGAGLFLTEREQVDAPYEVELRMRSDWQQSVSAMRRPANGKAHRYRANSYDELVDSPILVGNPTLHPFEVGGVTHYLVNQGGDGLWDGEAAAADAAKIVAEHQSMWGSVPYDRYYFLNVIAEGGGGLEHDNSSVLLASRWSYRSPSSYQRWLSLVSHEFFHTWNVRRLRPQALSSYDYETENYFDELWVAEGITSYYDDLALVRAGIATKGQYLSALSRQITTLQTTPGRLTQSLRDSSLDTWVKFYRPNENSSNATISYYNKGAVVAFLLDAKIREQTSDAKSLDDVMRQLYSEFASGTDTRLGGYTNADVQRVANEVAGVDLSGWFERAIDSTDELEYSSALRWLGLEFRAGPVDADDDLADASDDESSSDSKQASVTGEMPVENSKSEPDANDGSARPERSAAWLGVSTEERNGKLIVSRVTEGSPGFAAGINVGDELIALDGFRLDGSLTSRLRNYYAGDSGAFQIARRGRVTEKTVTFTETPRTDWTLRFSTKPTEQQTASLIAWLHLPEPEKPDDAQPESKP